MYFILLTEAAVLLGCKCKCKWTEFNNFIEISIDSKGQFITLIIGRVDCGKCYCGNEISHIDSYLIQDIKTYQTAYSYYSKYMKNHSTDTKLDICNIFCKLIIDINIIGKYIYKYYRS